VLVETAGGETTFVGTKLTKRYSNGLTALGVLHLVEVDRLECFRWQDNIDAPTYMQTNIARAGDYDRSGPREHAHDHPHRGRRHHRAFDIIGDDFQRGRVPVFLGSGAAEARERLPLIEPDVIVCDFVMDGVSGDEFSAG